mgnify:CR=1 FL=1
MIDKERMEEDKSYREGVAAGTTYGIIKTISKVTKLASGQKE